MLPHVHMYLCKQNKKRRPRRGERKYRRITYFVVGRGAPYFRGARCSGAQGIPCGDTHRFLAPSRTCRLPSYSSSTLDRRAQFPTAAVWYFAETRLPLLISQRHTNPTTLFRRARTMGAGAGREQQVRPSRTKAATRRLTPTKRPSFLKRPPMDRPPYLGLNMHFTQH